ncbi:MAG: hypothetical protein II948_02100 [Synergistaceae bacterium]|nr:hypothetical protein [Synergistaceae bacterium]MBQ4418727.1 hypothetical protein [Synergistaceae bacterium]MBQ9582522.1 hypothetical protein [Synergistaceae bacterium]MBR0222128.1 hypothetical protein [Synergistaceae bacterium]
MENDKYFQEFKYLNIPVEPMPSNYTPEEFGKRLSAMFQRKYSVSYAASTDYSLNAQR